MNNSPTTVARRMPWFRVVTLVWLLVLSASLLLATRHIQSLRTVPSPSPLTGEVNALSTRLSQTETQLATLPAPLTPEALTAVRIELEARLKSVEDALTTRANKPELEVLQERVKKLETGASTVRDTVSMPRKRPAAARIPKPLRPPFQVMGVDNRGGQRFLAIATPGAASLSQVRLIRQGESVQGWTLETIASGRATFRFNNQLRQLVTP
ncbi:hypothetical protein [Lelliottia amnigena]|uniref:hypothetical protein n=1 Tax=Lelliottia amnigena TaxID=61646 RepID=UPI0040561DEC